MVLMSAWYLPSACSFSRFDAHLVIRSLRGALDRYILCSTESGSASAFSIHVISCKIASASTNYWNYYSSLELFCLFLLTLEYVFFITYSATVSLYSSCLVKANLTPTGWTLGLSVDGLVLGCCHYGYSVSLLHDVVSLPFCVLSGCLKE